MEFVRVPRAAFGKWWGSGLPWAEVFAAAERGDDGLSVMHFGMQSNGPGESVQKWPDREANVAYLRQGTGSYHREAACLYQQGW